MLTSAVLTSIALALPQDRVEQWTADVLELVEGMERMHPDLFQTLAREELEGAVDGLLGRIEALSDDEVAVEVVRLAALPTLGGHSAVLPTWFHVLPTWFHVLPLQLYAFEEGWFVVGARGREAAAHADLVGAELLALGGRPIEEVVRAVSPLVTRDNDGNLRSKLPLTLSMVEVLAALDLAGPDGRVTFSLRGPDGREREAVLAGIPLGEVMHGGGARELLPERAGSRGLRGRERAWWTEVVPEARALYVQFNEVSATGPDGETVGELGARIVGTFDAPGLGDAQRLERVVLDLRSNGGGDNTTFDPLVAALKAHPGIDREGALFVLVGRATFSAAGNLVTVLERDTRATLVGEPTGGAPNQYGDTQPLALAHHPRLLVFVSTRYHAFGGAGDARLTHEPDVLVPARAADYFAGRDPALERALGLAAGK